jgi:Hint domain
VSRLEDPSTGLQSSRRNLIRIGAIVASAIIAKATSAAAGDFRRHDFDWDEDDHKHKDHDKDRDKDFHCFLTGTTIRTANGDRKIEDLAVGDLLPTVFGGTSPIRWIGRYRFKRSDPTKAWVKDVLPVSGCSVSPWSRCSACRFVYHTDARTADRWSAGGGRQPHQWHDDYTL